MWVSPVLTLLKAPLGASVCPELFVPQHVIDPLTRIAQLCVAPAVTLRKMPAGESVCPNLLSPQHEMVPLVVIAQLCP